MKNNRPCIPLRNLEKEQKGKPKKGEKGEKQRAEINKL